MEMAQLIRDEINLQIDAIIIYYDSKIVLGYIFNDTKSFFMYDHNRIQFASVVGQTSGIMCHPV